MNDTLETLLLMVVAAAAPVINAKVDETGFEAGQKLRDHVQSTDNTLDDTALETAVVGLQAIIRGIQSPRPAETVAAPAAPDQTSFAAQ